jgi:hypothetical protein
MRNGFTKIRAGLEEHMISGNVGFFEAGVYLTMHLQADFRSGLWIGSAPRLLATAPRGTSLRAIQHALERLQEIRFLRSFHSPGRRGNYSVLIHKYEPSIGALKGKRLNAWESESWKHPFYESVADDVTEAAPIQDVDVDIDKKHCANPSGLHESASPENPTKPMDETSLAIEEIWAWYIQTIKRNPKQYTFTPKRKAMGRKRWHECFARAAAPKAENATAMMKLCIDRLAQSAFHNGKNDQGRKYIDWEILFRSKEQMETWLNDDNYVEVK